MLSWFRTATEFMLSVPVVILEGALNDPGGVALLKGEPLDNVGRGLLVFIGTVPVGPGRFIGAVAAAPARFIGAVEVYPGRFMGAVAGRFIGAGRREALGAVLVLGSMLETNGVALDIDESPFFRGGALA
jgi:hypothetical protein